MLLTDQILAQDHHKIQVVFQSEKHEHVPQGEETTAIRWVDFVAFVIVVGHNAL